MAHFWKYTWLCVINLYISTRSVNGLWSLYPWLDVKPEKEDSTPPYRYTVYEGSQNGKEHESYP